MCGRFVASRPVEDIVDQFAVDDVRVPPELWPGARYNVSPQDQVLGIRAASQREQVDRAEAPAASARVPPGSIERRLGAYRWGLVPSWAKDASAGARAFNARAESIATKPMFRNALARRRCIIPADAYYEWQPLPAGTGAAGHAASPGGRAKRGGPKQAWCFRAADGALLAFAGLYEVWRATPEDEWLVTCTIITTEANDVMAPIHDRMPVVLQPGDYEAWLSPGELGDHELRMLLAPPPDELLVCHKVGPAVGSSRAEGPQLAEPLENSA